MNARFADIDDFNSAEFRKNYFELEEFSNRFVKSALKFNFFPKDYPWPLDPFHNWSRIWEYPFVWQQIKNIKNADKKSLRIADLGSGLTFFPWFLAWQGNSVCALDINQNLLPNHLIIEKMKRGLGIRGKIFYLVSDAVKISLRSNSFDAVTSVSLLEHLPDFQSSLIESKRVLIENGKLVATFDVSLDGLPFGDGMPLNLNQVNRMTNLKFDSIPKRSLRFSNHPRRWSKRSGPKISSLNGVLRWKIINQFIRPLSKWLRSRALIRPYSKIPTRVIRLLLSPARFDMWTVMGVAIQKSSIRR